MKANTGGFTLIELIVGVAIALIGITAMFIVQQNWDAQKRSISSGGDAQVYGAISAFQLERDLRGAGSGFGNSEYLGCTVSAHDVVGNRDFTFTYTPVVITNGTPTDPDAPDTISILSGNSNSPTMTFQVAAATSTQTTMKDTRTGIALGDVVVVATPANTCRMLEITNLQPASPDSGREVGHDTSGYTRRTRPPANRLTGAGACTGTGPWNCTPRFNPVTLATPYSSSPPTYGEFRSLGDDPRLNVWSIDSTRAVLMRSELLHGTTAVDIGEGIINLQAEYGLDTNGDDAVDTWTSATPTWTQVRAIRFAQLARGDEYDRVAVTTAAPTWSGGTFVMRNIDGTPDSGAGALGVNNWRNYRYSVFETTVVLRNMVWRRFW